ncbi:MAG: hypothetical protein DRN81_06905 [Thermoproteota archaeon]|nr:MAG: hypothetical protein DRN81_06905 [Candidatus Korarchaeota archaeon]
MLRNAGIDPTTGSLKAIGDAVAALGGGQEKFNRVLIAFAQIAAKGRVQAEELLQLMEAGIPVQKILQEELGLTNEQIAEIGKLGIDAQVVLDALFSGMQRRYGGAMAELMQRFTGIISNLRDQWDLWLRDIMNAGPWQTLTALLKMALDHINRLKEEGKLDEWAEKIGKRVEDTFWNMAIGTATAIDALKEPILAVWGIIEDMWEGFKKLPSWIREIGIVAAIVGGKKGAAVIASLSWLVETLGRSVKGFEYAWKGWISWKDYITANKEELEKLIQEADRAHKTTGELGDISLDTSSKMGNLEQKVRQIRKEVEKYIETLKDEQKQERKPTETPTAKIPVEFVFDEEKLQKLYQDTIDQINKTILQGQELQAYRAEKWYEQMMENIDTLLEAGQITGEEWSRLFDRIEEGYQKLLEKSGESFDYMQEFAIQAARNMQTAMSDFFFDVMTGKFESFKEYIQGLANTISRIISEILAKLALAKIFGAFGWQAGIAALGLAKGGIVPGPVVPIKQFQYGGIVDRPTLFLAGEGRYPEAIVPLPNGRAIPVQIINKTEEKPIVVHIHIQTPDVESFRASRAQIATEITMALARARR